MKKKMGEENFYIIADDANFYRANAFLDSLNVSYTNTDNEKIIAYKKNNKTEILSPIKSKWYSLLNQKGQLTNIDLVSFKDDYIKSINTNLKARNRDDIPTLLQKNISKPENIIEYYVFTKDSNDSLQINTEILDYISKTTTRQNSEYLIALEKYQEKYYNNDKWLLIDFSRIQAYIFNTTYPLRKKYWSDKFDEWYNGKPDQLLGAGSIWGRKNYYGLPKLEEYERDFRITYW